MDQDEALNEQGEDEEVGDGMNEKMEEEDDDEMEEAREIAEKLDGKKNEQVKFPFFYLNLGKVNISPKIKLFYYLLGNLKMTIKKPNATT